MDILDDESEFIARPYASPVVGVVPFRMYDSRDSEVAFDGRLSNAETMTACSFLSCSLPYFIGGAYGSTSYNPARVARQFGFDQGVPSPSVVLPVSDTFEQFFCHTHLPRLQKYSKFTRTRVDRVGGVTVGWRHYWKETFAAFQEFLGGDIWDLEFICVPSDNELCQPRVKGRTELARGELSRFARLELLSDVLTQARVVGTDSFLGEVGISKRRPSQPKKEPSQRMKVQRSATHHDVSVALRVAGVPSEEENSDDDLLPHRRLRKQSNAKGFSDSESEGDDGDSSEANLNARDDDVVKVTSERANVPLDRMRSEVVAPCGESRVTFAPPLLQLGHPVAQSVRLGESDVDDPTGQLPLSDAQSRLPPGGVPTISLFGESSGFSSVDAHLSVPSVVASAGAQTSLHLVDVQPGTLPASLGVTTSLPLGKSGSYDHDDTIAPNGQTSLPFLDGEFTVTRLDSGCVSLAGADGKEQVLDSKVLFAGVRDECLPRLSFIFDHRPSTFMRLEAMFLRRYLLEAFCDMLSGFHGLTPETSIDTFQSFQTAVAEFQRHEFEVSWLRESLSRMEVQVKNRHLKFELAEMDRALVESASSREKAVVELERATKALADVDLAMSSLRERRAVVEAQLISVEDEAFDLDSQIGPV
ncbi:uncharacterized protein LOC114262273 [Camellia sinensis]|uniref:uncharacterized protein LOC114262273 n=1 Tax=Camellia sinensis TaxID=4442 RepID=UPI0010363AD7|nr:uncharacterized protein LOC114262273 [Camellia sinensis]